MNAKIEWEFKMKNYLDKTHEKFITEQGDFWWELIVCCDCTNDPRGFTLKELVDELQQWTKLKNKTLRSYIALVLENVLRRNKAEPDVCEGWELLHIGNTWIKRQK